MKKTVGRVVLAAFLLAYLGILSVGERVMIIAIPGFVLTVLVGLWTAIRSSPQKGRSLTNRSSSPWKLGAAIAGSAVAVLVLAAGFSLLSGGRGISDTRDGGLLVPRERYLLDNHGVASEVERWRYLGVGLCFYTLWFGGGSAAAVLVFLRSPLSSPRATTPNPSLQRTTPR
jgi:hypothetical protein